jgi:hypothetical protein
MRRRQYLAGLGAGTSGLLGGCSGFGGGSSSTGTATESAAPSTGTGTGTPSTSVAEAFELTQLDVTERTRLNEPWAFGFSVRNRTDTTRVFRSTISARVDGGEWRQFRGEASFEVAPGKIKTWQSPRLRFRFLRTVTYRIDALDETWTVEVLPLELEYGLSYTSPVGLEITVGQVTFRDEKPTGSASGTDDTRNGTDGTGNETTTPTAPPPTAADRSGTKWAVVPVTVENPTERARPAPFPREFTFLADGEAAQDHDLDTPSLYHRDRALEPDEPLSGNLYYEIPAGTDANDIEVVLRRSYSGGEVEASDPSGGSGTEEGGSSGGSEIEVVWSR